MSSYICPFCQHTVAGNYDTHRMWMISFYGIENLSLPSSPSIGKSTRRAAGGYELKIDVYKCPNCEEISFTVDNYGHALPFFHMPIYPSSWAKQYDPMIIPEQLIKDYQEAYAILNLSPKASATLSRRCLQGIIRDFWKDIKPGNLSNEIQQLETKIPSDLWEVIDNIRNIGNIGAHMEKDVNLVIDIEPNEAEYLLMLIEQLFHDWYIDRHNRNLLYEKINAKSNQIKEAKQNHKMDDQ